MVFLQSLSDSNSSQLSRALLSILPDLSKAVVWIISARPPISSSSSPLTQPLKTVPNALIIISIMVTFMFHMFFSSPARSEYLSLFSFSLIFFSVVRRDAKAPNVASSLFLFFFFFINGHEVWSSGLDKLIRLYPKIPENFIRLIFPKRFCFLYIAFGSRVNFQFIAQFPVITSCQLCWYIFLIEKGLYRYIKAQKRPSLPNLFLSCALFMQVYKLLLLSLLKLLLSYSWQIFHTK